MNRRSLLLGVSGLAIGAGGLVGTGAFTTVQANRFARVETTGDASAFLGLQSLNDVLVTETGGTIEINLDGPSGAPSCGTTTSYENLVSVTNQGTQTVRTVQFEIAVSGAAQDDDSVENALKIRSGSAVIDATREANLLVRSDAEDAADDELAPGESFPFGIDVDLLDVPISCIDGNPNVTLTIVADTTAAPDESPPDEGSDGDEGSGSGDEESLSACPISPDISASVGGAARESLRRNSDISREGIEVDGDVVTEDGSGGDISLTDVTVTGGIESDSGIGTFDTVTVGGTVRANGGDISDDDPVVSSSIGGSVITENGSGGDVAVVSSTVCGQIESDRNVNTLTNSDVGGTVDASGNININTDVDIDTDGSVVTEVLGNVTSDSGDITASDQVTVEDSVEASGGGDITLGSSESSDITVNGYAKTNDGGNIAVGNSGSSDVLVGGFVKAAEDGGDGGNVNVGNAESSSVEVQQYIEAEGDGNVTIADAESATVTVQQYVRAVGGGDVNVGNAESSSVEIRGDIETNGDGSITIADSESSSVEIDGNVETNGGGEITIGSGSEVSGNVTAKNADITIADGATVDGDVATTGSGEVTVNGTVNGQVNPPGSGNAQG